MFFGTAASVMKYELRGTTISDMSSERDMQNPRTTCPRQKALSHTVNEGNDRYSKKIVKLPGAPVSLFSST
jgi:hypothetical protein